MSKVLVIDNFDSFTFNLVHYVEALLQEDVTVVRNSELDKLDWDEWEKVLISPGPGLPKEAGQLMQTLPKLENKKVLGVCLGMQALLAFYGHPIQNLKEVIHGRATSVTTQQTQSGIFKGLPTSFLVGRYHSWVGDPQALPSSLEATAITNDGLLMAFAHRTRPIYGVQFHPESVLTEHGKQMIKNWLET